MIEFSFLYMFSVVFRGGVYYCTIDCACLQPRPLVSANLFVLENVLEAGRCVVDAQCSEIENKRRCVGGRCVCVEGYALIENNCSEGKFTQPIENGY